MMNIRSAVVPGILVSGLLVGLASRRVAAQDPQSNPTLTGVPARVARMVIVPGEDRFTPLAVTIKAGDVVEWVNMDTDDHTVVSDDTFNTTDHKGFNHLLPGTDSNGGKPGTIRLRFIHTGTFVYYCRFHSHLDSDHQPVAPGPDGGIQDSNGNFGTPMMGVVTVLAKD
jgi:plastocyanin